MAVPLRRLNPARAFPSEIEDAVLRIAEVRREFLKNNLLVLPQPVRSIIRESWERCAPLIEPGLVEAPIIVASEAELRDLQIRNEIFLRAAQPVIHRLTELVAGSSYIIGLADRDGRLLQVSGDRQELRRMERIGLTPGGDWSESTVGTNGIGTAIAVDHAVVVMGPEHFCDSWQNFSCITAPIHNPRGGEIVGVLDISGDYHLLRPVFTGILTAAALEIRENFTHLIALPTQRMSSFSIPQSGARSSSLNERINKPTVAPGRTVWFRPAGTISRRRFKYPTSFKRRTIAAERLAIATGTIGSSLDIQTTLSQVAQQAAYLLGSDSAAVCLIDETEKPIFLRAWSKLTNRSSNLIEFIQTLVSNTQVIKLLRESGEPVAIDDLSFTMALPVDQIEKYGFRALALLPLQSASRVKGFIAVSCSDPHHWQPDDLRLGLTFAYHAATAVENARLYLTLQQHERQVEALNEVNQLLHMLYDPAQQLDLIIERIVEIMDLDGGMILLNQGFMNSPALLAAHSGLSENTLVDLFEIAVNNAAIRNSILVCRNQPGMNSLAERLAALGLYFVIITPLVAGNDLLGDMLLSSYRHRDLTLESLTLLNSIGQQLGLALKNAQLLRSAGEAQALREADRIKSRFLMMVSHDLRSPLTAIGTSVESLLDPSGLPSTHGQEQLLRNIAGQSKRLGKLVDHLLDLTRIEARALQLDRDWTELDALIIDTVSKFERLNGPCQIKQCLASHLPLVYIDPERIIQVLWNLLENALKYAPPVEEISVEAFSTSSEIFINVSDRGPGIPIEDRDKIFEYFYRLPHEQQLHAPGSGLGLAICRGIINAHGGRIWVSDRPGGGSVFSITLPHSAPDPAEMTGFEPQETDQLFSGEDALPIKHIVTNE